MGKVLLLLTFTIQNVEIMKKEQTQNTFKKFELNAKDQHVTKGGYAPVGLGDIIGLNKKISIWGEVEVRRPNRKFTISMPSNNTRGGNRFRLFR